MATSSAYLMHIQNVEKSLTSIESAQAALGSIRVEINRYWETLSQLATSSSDLRVLERDLDALIEGHDRAISGFVKAVNHLQPPTRSISVVDQSGINYDKVVSTKKRNRQQIQQLQITFHDELDKCDLTAMAFPQAKRAKISPAPPDVAAIEKLLLEWIENTGGEFQILTRQAPAIIGKPVLGPGGRATVSTTKYQPAAVSHGVIPSPLTSISGTKATQVPSVMSTAIGNVEVRITVKGVAVFSILLTDSSSGEPCGIIIKATCSNILESICSNVWSNSSEKGVMAAMNAILRLWFAEHIPSLPRLLAYLRTLTDIYKTTCCSCDKWLKEDGAWGILPPLFPLVSPVSQPLRRHFTCTDPV